MHVSMIYSRLKKKLLSKHTNHLFTKLYLFTKIVKISEISCFSVTFKKFCVPIFFPCMDHYACAYVPEDLEATPVCDYISDTGALSQQLQHLFPSSLPCGQSSCVQEINRPYQFHAVPSGTSNTLLKSEI
jgi:hypothetical protein